MQLVLSGKAGSALFCRAACGRGLGIPNPLRQILRRKSGLAFQWSPDLYFLALRDACDHAKRDAVLVCRFACGEVTRFADSDGGLMADEVPDHAVWRDRGAGSLGAGRLSDVAVEDAVDAKTGGDHAEGCDDDNDEAHDGVA